MNREMVYISVPAPLYNQDSELNTMAMLDFLMQQQFDVLTADEVKRIATWFASKYQDPKPAVRG